MDLNVSFPPRNHYKVKGESPTPEQQTSSCFTDGDDRNNTFQESSPAGTFVSMLWITPSCEGHFVSRVVSQGVERPIRTYLCIAETLACFVRQRMDKMCGVVVRSVILFVAK